MKRKCDHCGAGFTARYRTSEQRFCSRDCVRRATKAGAIERNRFWTDYEIGELEGLSHLSARDAGRELERSAQSVQHMRNKLRDGWSADRIAWTEEEDDFLRRSTHFTAKEVAEHLGRTASSVNYRRGTLSRAEGIDFTKGDHKSPFVVGSRRLLAKSCVGCGLLLDASWFAKSKGRTWRSRCTRCVTTNAETGEKYNRRSGAQLDGGKSARESAAKLQRITRMRATRHGYPWIESDHVVLRDSTLSVFEKAIKLGRTWSATHMAVRQNGYTSRVGKGDPMHGVWRIENPNHSIEFSTLLEA